MLDIQILKIEPLLHIVERVSHVFLEAHPFVVEQRDKRLIIAPVAERVVASAAFRVNAQLLHHILSGGAAFDCQVEGDVLEVEVACDIDRCAAKLILLHKHLQDIVLVKLLVLLREPRHDLRKLPSVHHREDAGAVEEVLRSKRNRQVHQLFLVLLHHFDQKRCIFLSRDLSQKLSYDSNPIQIGYIFFALIRKF